MKDIFVGNIHGHFSQSLPASLLGVSVSYCQRTLGGESGMIRTQMGKHIRPVVVAAWDAMCDTTP
jgi:hypothetical protein